MVVERVLERNRQRGLIYQRRDEALRAVVLWSHILSPTLTATRADDLVEAVEHVIGKVDAVGGEVGIAVIVSAWPDDRAGDPGSRRAKLIDSATS